MTSPALFVSVIRGEYMRRNPPLGRPQPHGGSTSWGVEGGWNPAEVGDSIIVWQ